MDKTAAYRANAVTTQSRGKIVVMLYEGAINFLRQAIRQMDAEDWLEAGKMILKAKGIIEELNYCLDTEAGGELAANLRSLYFFMIGTLTQAHVRKDREKLEQVVSLLAELNEGWQAIAT